MTERGESTFWTYEDLLLFMGAVAPVYILGALFVRLAGPSQTNGKTLLFQSVVYALLLGTLYLLIALRYHQPFWRSLGFFLPERGMWACVFLAPVLAITTSALGVALHTPLTDNPIEDLISDRASLIIVMLFAVVLGPAFEELIFRGFLLPLLVKSFGPAAGILMSAIPFAILHGAQNQWAWQPIVLIGFAGLAFGYARYKTGSTLASTILHCGYNTTLFAGYLAQRSQHTV
jgi:membrane protease YdiL (CAAX protease family)